MDEMFLDRAVGIDLGTTNSAVALLDPSERDIVVWADRFGRQIVPSAVAWDPKSKEVVVGRAARNRRGQTPGPIESIKRSMGQAVTVEVGPHTWRPEDVSARILAELRRSMAERLAQAAADGITVRVDRAVITVPAYFDAPQVEATRAAGELAGFEVIGVLQEPTAAAIYHTWKRRLGDGSFLVYDLGGGTFDVSVLRCMAGEYQVLAIDGDNYLGGDDLDRRFAERLRSRLAEAGYRLDLDVLSDPADEARFGRLVHLAQEIKESLSTTEVVAVNKQDFMEDQAGEPVTFEAEVGRAEYEELVGELVERTIQCCERALARSHEVAGVGAADIDHVVLVGGSTRVPLVQRRVIEAVCAKGRSESPLADEVDTCVAFGAAVHAAQVGGLRIGRGDGRATVSFTTPLVTRTDRLKLGVRVETAPDGTDEVAVIGDDVLARAEIAGLPAETRLEVPVPADGETRVRIALSKGGDRVAELPFAIYRGDVKPRASGLSQPSVIAKDIAIEVVRGGRRERRVLLARGTGLPAEVSHRFFTGDQSGAVVLRILQDRLPIKTVLLEVPTELEVGSPVDLTLRCDEAMRLEARARVGQQDLWVQVEPAAQANLDPTGTVQRLLAEVEQVERNLWGGDAHLFRREAEPLVAGVREVVGTDPAKLGALCARLALLLDEFRARDQADLSPPYHRFEAVLDRLRRIIYRSSAQLMGMTREAWDERIGRLDDEARAAWDSADAMRWRRYYNEAQALLETASQEEFASMRLDDPAYLARSVRRVSSWTDHLTRQLTDFVPSASDEVRELQLAERDRLLRSLMDRVAGPLETMSVEDEEASRVRRKLEELQDELGRIEDAFERIPSLGLVTERGGGASS